MEDRNITILITKYSVAMISLHGLEIW